MILAECDTCRKHVPPDAAGWFVIAQQPSREDVSPFSFIIGSSGPSALVMFCQWKCLAEYAIARALAAEVEPPGGLS